MKLSVMMITYNQERFIGQAIQSVLAQRVNFDYEIVIGEDFSTDGTRAVVMDFYRRDPNRIVPLLRDRNIGGAANLIATLAACRGQYVALLEGDDYWTCEDKLKKQIDFLETHPNHAMCCHRVQYIDATGFIEADVFPSLAAGTYSIEDLLRGNFVMTCSTVLRRDLVGALPARFSEVQPGDWLLFALVARHGKIELMDEVMAAYRVHYGASWSSLPSLSRLRETSRMLRVLDKYLEFQYTDTIRQTIVGPYLELAGAARLKGNRRETAKHLSSCIRNGGWQLPGCRRTLAGLLAYILIGSWYKLFSKATSASSG